MKRKYSEGMVSDWSTLRGARVNVFSRGQAKPGEQDVQVTYAGEESVEILLPEPFSSPVTYYYERDTEVEFEHASRR
jgi:hypothetical protein